VSHTPGPWMRTDDGFRIYQKVGPHVGAFIAQTAFNAQQRTNEAKDNARLIALAPDLLEALKLLVERHYRQGGHIVSATEIQEAEMLIQKVEGR